MSLERNSLGLVQSNSPNISELTSNRSNVSFRLDDLTIFRPSPLPLPSNLPLFICALFPIGHSIWSRASLTTAKHDVEMNLRTLIISESCHILVVGSNYTRNNKRPTCHLACNRQLCPMTFWDYAFSYKSHHRCHRYLNGLSKWFL